MSDLLKDKEIKKRKGNLTGDEPDKMLMGRDAIFRFVEFGVVIPLFIILVVYLV